MGTTQPRYLESGIIPGEGLDTSKPRHLRPIPTLPRERGLPNIQLPDTDTSKPRWAVYEEEQARQVPKQIEGKTEPPIEGRLVPGLYGEEMELDDPHMSPRRRRIAESILTYGKETTREFEFDDPEIVDSITTQELQWAANPPRGPLAKTLETLFGETMGRADEYLVRALASDDPYDQMKATTDFYTGLAKEWALWGVPGTLAFKGLGKLIKGGAATPRLVAKQVSKILPEQMKPWPTLVNVWERWAVPKGDIPPISEGVLVNLREAMRKKWLKVNPITGRILPTYEGRKSFAEIMQPAVERLERVKRGFGTLAAPFRTSQAHKALVTKAGEHMTKDFKALPLADRLEVMKGLRGLTVESEAAREVLWNFERRVGEAQLKPAYQRHYQDAWEKIIQKDKYDFGDIENISNFPEVKDFFNSIDDFIAGKPLGGIGPQRALPKGAARTAAKIAKKPDTVKLIQKKLAAVIEHPFATKEMKILARDMYNLPVRAPQAIAEASKDASVSFLIDRLKQMGTVKASLKEGDNIADYMISKFPKTKDMFVLRDVELELRTLNDMPKIAHKWANKWFMTPWKTSKVILRPATHVRNALSNVILNDWGGLPMYRGDIYYKAWKEMRRGGKNWREWQKLTGGGGTFSMNEIVEMGKGLTYGSNMMDHGLALFDRMASVPRAMYNAEEQFAKMAKFIWNKQKGMAPREAAVDAMKWTFNYGEVTRATSLIRGNLAPFFTWQSKVIPLMAETAVKHPLRLGKYFLLYQTLQANAIEANKITPGEWEFIEKILPDYMQEGQFLLMPWRDERDRLQFLNLTYMIPGFGDLAELNAHPMGELLGHPFLTIGGALLSKTKFSGAPLYHDWEEPQTKFAKSMAYVWEQLVPSLMYGGVDWNKMERMIKDPDNPNTYTWEQMMATASGFPIKPLDIASSARRRAVVDQIHRQEMGSQMKRELRTAKTPSGRRKIAEKYMRLRRELVEP